MKHLPFLLTFILTACAPIQPAAQPQPTPPPLTETVLPVSSPTPEPSPTEILLASPTATLAGTIVAETEFGRIIETGAGAYSIELNEAPLPPERTEAERQAAIDAIRKFFGSTDLPLTYGGLLHNAENSGMPIESYQTPSINFMVDIKNNQIVYFQSNTGNEGIQLDLNTAPSLQDLARQFALDHNPCFASKEPQLVFEDGSKSTNHFYRWHIPGPNLLRPWNQPTFTQISIRDDGLVFGYLDSGICYLDDI